MGGYYPTPDQPGPGRSTGPGHEFQKLLRDTPFQPSEPADRRAHREFQQFLKDTPFKTRQERILKPSVPLVPWKALGPGIAKLHPWIRAFDLALQLMSLWDKQRLGRVGFGPGWYHECGDLTALPPGVCGYKYGTASGHTVSCGTSSQVPAGNFPPATAVSVPVGASGAQFHMGRGHLACLRMHLDEVWRYPPGIGPAPDIVPLPARAPIMPPWPIPDYTLPPELWPPLTPAPPYPYPPHDTLPVPGRSPTENHETGPKREPRPQVKPWPEPWQPPPFVPPKTRTRERKFKFADDWLYQFATHLMGLFTEFSDMVDVVWKSLPAHLQARYRNAGLDTKAKIIYDNYMLIDGQKLVEGLIADWLEDAAIGKLGNKVADAVAVAAKNGLYVSPKGLSFKLADLPPIEWSAP